MAILPDVLKKMCLIILIGTLSGCAFFSLSGPKFEYPILPSPPKPNLAIVSEEDLAGLDPIIIEDLIQNDARLKNYSSKLAKIIDEYNKFAKDKND